VYLKRIIALQSYVPSPHFFLLQPVPSRHHFLGLRQFFPFIQNSLAFVASFLSACPHHPLLSSDGSRYKILDPGQVRSCQPFLVWVWIRKISPKNVKFFHFFSSGRVKKYPGQRRVGSYLLWVKSKLGLGRFRAHLYCRARCHQALPITKQAKSILQSFGAATLSLERKLLHLILA